MTSRCFKKIYEYLYFCLWSNVKASSFIFWVQTNFVRSSTGNHRMKLLLTLPPQCWLSIMSTFTNEILVCIIWIFSTPHTFPHMIENSLISWSPIGSTKFIRYQRHQNSVTVYLQRVFFDFSKQSSVDLAHGNCKCFHMAWKKVPRLEHGSRNWKQVFQNESNILRADEAFPLDGNKYSCLDAFLSRTIVLPSFNLRIKFFCVTWQKKIRKFFDSKSTEKHFYCPLANGEIAKVCCW